MHRPFHRRHDAIAERRNGEDYHAGAIRSRSDELEQRCVGGKRLLFALFRCEPGQRVDAERRQLRRPREGGANGEIGGAILERAEFMAGIASGQNGARILFDFERTAGGFVDELRPALACPAQRKCRSLRGRQFEFGRLVDLVLRVTGSRDPRPGHGDQEAHDERTGNAKRIR